MDYLGEQIKLTLDLKKAVERKVSESREALAVAMLDANLDQIDVIIDETVPYLLKVKSDYADRSIALDDQLEARLVLRADDPELANWLKEQSELADHLKAFREVFVEIAIHVGLLEPLGPAQTA